MQTKYSNIFWHEGVKIFSDRMLDTAGGQQRIAHLENDVTKALLNLFEHGSSAFLKSFLRMLHVNDAPESFSFDFQVTDMEACRRQPRRIMLVIMAASTPTKSDPSYRVTASRPDGCIANDRTAILIEVKTQSPLVIEQLDSHIRHYLGTATETPRLTWEDISDNFRTLVKTRKLSVLDEFLVTQFLNLLNLLGIDQFHGFPESDFTTIADEARMMPGDYLDFRRQFMRKAEKFTAQIYDEVKNAFPFRQMDYYPRSDVRALPTGWTALYFHDGDRSISVNEYPNINFNYNRTGIVLGLNSEVQSAWSKVLAVMRRDPVRMEDEIHTLAGMRLAVSMKLQFRPQDHFIWKFLPGYPLATSDVQVERVLADIAQMEEDWGKHRRTLLFEMEQGLLLRSSGERFSESELQHAATRNPRAKYAISIEKRYAPADVAQLGGNIVGHVARDIRRASGYMRLVVGEE
jgi:hypothetical protein